MQTRTSLVFVCVDLAEEDEHQVMTEKGEEIRPGMQGWN